MTNSTDSPGTPTTGGNDSVGEPRRPTPGRARAERSGSHRPTPALLAVIAAFGFSACAGADEESSVEAPASESGDWAADSEGSAGSAAVDVDPAIDDPVTIDLGEIGRDVIVEVFVTMTSDDIRRSVAVVSAKASQLGGGVASSNVDYGDPSSTDGRGYATLVVKVPPDAVDDLLAGAEQTGTVRSVNQSVEDVTAQLVDLDVRIENARRSVANVQGFMDDADDLTDLVLLESELTRRQTELEQLEAQQQNLTERVALSTVTIEILPTDALPVDEDDSLAGAFRDGWDGFVAFARSLAFGLALMSPFLVTGGVVVGGLVALRRRRRGGPGGDTANPTG